MRNDYDWTRQQPSGAAVALVVMFWVGVALGFLAGWLIM